MLQYNIHTYIHIIQVSMLTRGPLRKYYAHTQTHILQVSMVTVNVYALPALIVGFQQ